MSNSPLADRPAIVNGGWTADDEHDLCAGGHPGGTYRDTEGDVRCHRCGRLMDMSPCGCQGHGQMVRSFCPDRGRQDRLAANREHRASLEAALDL